MNTTIMVVAAILSVALVIFMLIKKMDIKITLFAIGMILMYVGVFVMGNPIDVKGFETSGIAFLDPFFAIVAEFKAALTSYGFVLLVLGGYTTYMSAIGANDVTVHVLTKPISKIKSPYVLVPIVFLLGNLLSLVIPSASTLAIILFATLMPILKKAGMSNLTIAGVIATTATVMPTPMGSDNVAIATELAQYPAFTGLTVTDYVLKYHAMVSIPTIIFMTIVQYFWQKHEDKKMGYKVTAQDYNVGEEKVITGSTLYKVVYALLPVLPMLILILSFVLKVLGNPIDISVEVATLVSFVIAIFCEIIRKKSGAKALQDTEKFFTGMGTGLPVVALTVAAVIFVDGLKTIGLINTLQTSMEGVKGNGLGFVLPLILVGLTALIVLMSGSGTSLFFAMVPLMVPLAEAAGISPLAISIPMGLAGNLLRAVSPVSAVVVISSGSVDESPLAVVRRTSVPMVAGTVFMFVLSMILFV